MQKDCILCEVRLEAAERIDYLKITTKACCDLCELRAEAEDTVDDVTL
jgi:hypothetical protein